ncbi:fumarylacetoacetate hydrolase family protein [Micromonospora sp. WMMD882]|uniref:fumarylacetoacetate hydrolase family protein n=1 Tax=Micromonospora sp. WMMD882 TaxID=3015151 RepID=UPI00248CDF33|nr:fumarylacetoacetate hydrolase family protein [Micromonospora sp. WMMD882]WBB80331.1 fumarylacetoacetate hydrolase family protein [Micromonospora sp. WMMD882]
MRYTSADGSAAGVAVRDDDGALRQLPFPSLAAALRVPLAELREAVTAADRPAPPDVRLLPPVDGRTEVWGGGVTYQRSRQARMEESAAADVYARLYDAERPELFLKSVAWRVVTDGEPIGVREDSALNLPEAELGVVANAAGELVGYTVVNDVTSRSIEGENPLYLPQAKVYAGSCAISPGIRPAWEVDRPDDLAVSCTVLRDGRPVWSEATSTAQLRRPPTELLSWLYRQDTYPDGVVLSTGTGLVPELDFTLREDDIVEIDIAEVGRLRNHVARGVAAFTWLRDDATGRGRA